MILMPVKSICKHVAVWNICNLDRNLDECASIPVSYIHKFWERDTISNNQQFFLKLFLFKYVSALKEQYFGRNVLAEFDDADEITNVSSLRDLTIEKRESNLTQNLNKRVIACNAGGAA